MSEDAEDIQKVIAEMAKAQRKKERQKSTIVEEEIAVFEGEDDVPLEVAHAILGKDMPDEVFEEDAAQEPSDAVNAPAMLMDRMSEALRRAEAVLFASEEPVEASQLALLLPPGADVAGVLMELKGLYQGRGVNLVEIAGGWRFQTAPDLAFLFEETREEERKLSKAAMETLSIIAYCQPCTRAEIEDVRGVAVSKGTIDVLLEMKWIRLRGRRKTPGRPVVYGTTDAFLEHFGLPNLDALPGRDEMKSAGLLSSNIPDDFEMPRPSDSEADEDLLEIVESASDEGDFHTDFMDEERSD